MFIDITGQIIGENIKFETHTYGFQKKTLLLDMFRKLSFALKVSENISDKLCCNPLVKNFRSVAYKLHICSKL